MKDCIKENKILIASMNNHLIKGITESLYPCPSIIITHNSFDFIDLKANTTLDSVLLIDLDSWESSDYGKVSSLSALIQHHPKVFFLTSNNRQVIYKNILFPDIKSLNIHELHAFSLLLTINSKFDILSSIGSDVPLTPRQSQVIELLALGESKSVVCSKLNIAYKTLSTHIRDILHTAKFKRLSHFLSYTSKYEQDFHVKIMK